MLERDFKSLEYDKIKELLSIKCLTYIGQELVMQLVPSSQKELVERLQQETTEAVSLYLRKGSVPLAPIPHFEVHFQKIAVGASLSTKELMEIANLLMLLRRLKKYFLSEEIDTSDFFIMREYYDDLYTNQNVEEEIFRCIKSEDMIDDRASKTLYDIRRKLTDCETQIKSKLNQMMKSHAKFLQEAVITFRNGRYVIPVKQEYRNEIDGLIHDASGSGNTLFMEPTAIFNINNEMKELKIQEQLEIERILALLTQMVAPLVEELKKSIYLIGKIDFANAKAKLSIEMDAFQPIVNDKHFISLKKARHPLIPKKDVVPIDIWIGEKYNVLIITGPNTGGKTVALKTVGLFSLMAQSGLHIPAMESSELPVFDHIYSDIGDEQSIEQSLSTFSSHMKNVVDILENVTKNSLVLLDELGSGTDPVEGAALATTILEKLHEVGCLSIATTHYSELKVFAIKTEGIENASCEFDVESLRPTYRLLIGIPGKSNAFAISQKLGLSEEIIQRASSLLSQNDIRFEDILGDMERDRRIAREQRELSDRLLKEAQEQKEITIQEQEKLNQKKDSILQKAREEARDLLLDAEEEANDIIKELTSLKHSKDTNVNKKAEAAREKIKANLSKMQKELVMPSKEVDHPLSKETVKVGMEVYLPSLDERGTILSMPDRKENVQVQIGLLKMNVHLSQMKEMKQTNMEKAKSKVSGGNLISSKIRDISTEINVIGKNVDEAIMILDKYIDDAYLASLKTIRIVHGKGTGALRKGIQEYLKNHPHIASYRNGLYGEGENGVTIAELK